MLLLEAPGVLELEDGVEVVSGRRMDLIRGAAGREALAAAGAEVGVGAGGGFLGRAYNLTHSFAVASCLFLFRLYSCAIAGTSGSAGFGSVRRDDRDKITLYSDSAGDQAVLRRSRQIAPVCAILQ